MSSKKARAPISSGASIAVLAAVAFGLTTPLIRRFGRGMDPFTTAALLYAGAALSSVRIGARPGDAREARLRRRHVARLVSMAALGALIAPVLFAWGLGRTSAFSASLLLNVEAVFTVALAWRFFREPVGPRVLAALLMMVGGGALLVVDSSPAGALGWGALAIVLATLAWALDNTLSRPLAALDPTEVVRWKAVVGAGLCALIALVSGAPIPELVDALAILLCGAVGYGLSLRLYLLAQRRIGAARTGSIFAVAPFVGAAAAYAAGERPMGALGVVGGGLFLGALYLHLTERHGHRHTHASLEHEHAHRHDDGHHEHVHDPPFDGEHSHLHRHDERTHDHPHAPDEHHAHSHA